MATAQGPVTIEDYVRAHANDDPQTLLKLLTQRERIPMNADGTFAPRTLEDVYRIGQMYANSELVPDTYKNKPANCAVAIEYAQQLGVPPLFFMQQSFIVRGKPAISAALMIALLNKSKKLRTSLLYSQGGEGQGRWWTATAIDASTGQEVSFTITWAMVEAEGWHLERSSQKSKWATLPDLMGRYRAASYLIRTHYPDVLMGLVEVEEARDSAAPEETRGHGPVTGAPIRNLAGLAAAAKTSVAAPVPAPATEEPVAPGSTPEQLPAQESNTNLAAGEIPPMDAYESEMRPCVNQRETGACYDKYFHPDSPYVWTPEQAQRGYEIWQAKNKELRSK